MSGSSSNRYEPFNISTKLDQIADQIATAVPKRSRYSLPEADQVISAIAHTTSLCTDRHRAGHGSK